MLLFIFFVCPKKTNKKLRRNACGKKALFLPQECLWQKVFFGGFFRLNKPTVVTKLPLKLNEQSKSPKTTMKSEFFPNNYSYI